MNKNGQWTHNPITAADKLVVYWLAAVCLEPDRGITPSSPSKLSQRERGALHLSQFLKAGRRGSIIADLLRHVSSPSWTEASFWFHHKNLTSYNRDDKLHENKGRVRSLFLQVMIPFDLLRYHLISVTNSSLFWFHHKTWEVMTETKRYITWNEREHLISLGR